MLRGLLRCLRRPVPAITLLLEWWWLLLSLLLGVLLLLLRRMVMLLCVLLPLISQPEVKGMLSSRGCGDSAAVC
jgi:hypothetical protein